MMVQQQHAGTNSASDNGTARQDGRAADLTGPILETCGTRCRGRNRIDLAWHHRHETPAPEPDLGQAIWWHHNLRTNWQCFGRFDAAEAVPEISKDRAGLAGDDGSMAMLGRNTKAACER